MKGSFKGITLTVTVVVDVSRAEFCGQFYRWISKVIPADISKVLFLGNILMFWS